MSRGKRKTIGILGGMGPEATAYFFDLIVKNTAAARDQDHVPVVVYSLPQTPDRTEAILRGGPSPLPMLVRGLRALHRAGADFAVMPCVSAHFFYPTLTARSPIPILHLPRLTAREVRQRRPPIKKVGLIATAGTVESRVFQDVLEPAGIEVLVPDARTQKRVMEAIYGKRGIKAGTTTGSARKAVIEVAAGLVRRGAQAVIAGCTEVPLVLREGNLRVPLIEPMRLAALESIRRAGGKLRRGGAGASNP
jgi:aspartate racemase